jgi:predicted protein tyrosine phosphatase
MTKLSRALDILGRRIKEQGLHVTVLWAADHAVRIIAGAPIRSLSQISPAIHVGGQYRRRGWGRLRARGVTAVVNMRIEFDDEKAGIAPPRYLHIRVVDDDTPTIEQLHRGSAFIQDESRKGGSAYIHCGSGIGRAPTMAAAYLISTGLTAEQAWNLIRQTRPFIRPTAVQVEQIERFAARLGDEAKAHHALEKRKEE